DTVTLPSRGRSPSLVQCDRDLEYARTMSNFVVANGDIGDPANRTSVVLIGRRQQNCKAALTKTTPNIFEHIALEQNSLGILQFEEILDNESIACGTAHEAGLVRFPDHGFEKMVAPDL